MEYMVISNQPSALIVVFDGEECLTPGSNRIADTMDADAASTAADGSCVVHIELLEMDYGLSRR